MRNERTYVWHDPADLAAAAAGQSGLDVLRAMAEGRLTATAEVVTRGREIVTAEAKLKDSGGRLFANATSTLMILRMSGVPDRS